MKINLPRFNTPFWENGATVKKQDTEWLVISTKPNWPLLMIIVTNKEKEGTAKEEEGGERRKDGGRGSARERTRKKKSVFAVLQ